MERVMRAIGLAGSAVFVLVVGTLHALEPGLAPATHVVSEYANTPFGWLLTAGLLGWAASLLAMAGWVVHRPEPLRASGFVAALLGVAAAGLVMAAAFRTQAVGGSVPRDVRRTVTGTLHDGGAGIATLALFAAAATVAFAEGAKSRLGRISLAAVAFAVVVQAGLLLVGHEVGGIRQRLLVIAGCAWQAAVLSTPRARQAD